MKTLALTLSLACAAVACGRQASDAELAEAGAPAAESAGQIGDGPGDAALRKFTAWYDKTSDAAACTAAVKAVPGLFDVIATTDSSHPLPPNMANYVYFTTALDSALDAVFHLGCIKTLVPSKASTSLLCFGPSGQGVGCNDYAAVAKRGADFYECAHAIINVPGVANYKIIGTSNAGEQGRLKFVTTKKELVEAVAKLECVERVDLLGPTQSEH